MSFNHNHSTKRLKGDLENLLGKNLFSRSNDGAILDLTNTISLTDSTGKTFYTVSMYMPDRPSNELYNFVIGKDSTGNYSKPYVVRYKSNPESLENWINSDLDFRQFEGNVSTYPYTDFIESFDLAASGSCEQYDVNGDPIPCQELVISGFSGTGDISFNSSSTGSSNITGGGGGCTFTQFWRDCGGSKGSQAHSAGPGNCGGDGGGAGWVVEMDCGPDGFFTMNMFKSSGCEDCTSLSTGSAGVNTQSRSLQKLHYYFETYTGIGLIDSEYLWLTNNNGSVIAEKINNYLIQEAFSDASVQFARLMLNAEMNDQTVDYDDKIINAIVNPCLSNTVDNLLNSQNTIADLINETFGGAEAGTPNLRFTSGNLGNGPDINHEYHGQTASYWDDNGELILVDITIDERVAGGSNLYVFNTILHEAIHGLLSYHASIGNLEMIEGQSEVLMDDLINAWRDAEVVRRLNNGGTTEDQELMEHQVMADLINAFEEANQSFGVSVGLPPDEYAYYGLAWVGLYGTVDYQVLTEDEQTAILNSISYEYPYDRMWSVGAPCN